MVVAPLIYACILLTGWGTFSLRLIGFTWCWSFVTSAILAAGIGWAAWDAMTI